MRGSLFLYLTGLIDLIEGIDVIDAIDFLLLVTFLTNMCMKCYYSKKMCIFAF